MKIKIKTATRAVRTGKTRFSSIKHLIHSDSISDKTLPKVLDHLDYYNGTVYDAVERSARLYPDNMAYEFLGNKVSYNEFIGQIDLCAKALKAEGLKEKEVVTIALPNCPQALCVFYAASRIGAVASVIHPLSSEREIEHCLNVTKSVMIVTLNQFYDKFENVFGRTPTRKIIFTGIDDGLGFFKSIGYKFYVNPKSPKIPKNGVEISWNAFMKSGKNYEGEYIGHAKSEDPAAILFSGGTSGTTKGVVITNYSFNAFGAQIINSTPSCTPGDIFLAAMPLFHGFGLGVCVHSMLFAGSGCILIPKFTPKNYLKLISTSKCQFFAGVPTLFEAILRVKSDTELDFSHLKGVFSGGDSLPYDLKVRFDEFLKENNASVQIREGYGATETLAACCLTPFTGGPKGSIGLPFADTSFKIVEPETDKELPAGETGEIIISGPSVMKEYIGNPEETEKTLKTHSDGKKWLYTGDLGYRDEDGYIYFCGRAKRMIIASGYNVYPNQIESVLCENSMIDKCCVIGVSDKYRIQKIKAFIVLTPDTPKNEATKKQIMDYCFNNIARYAKPNEIEFRDELPVTKLGKIDFKALEKEEEEKQQ